nr:hypothetical protein [Maribacter aestuarii]
MEKKLVKNVDLGSFAIVATFFSLWLAVSFEKDIEDIMAYVLILTFGILHGANDIKLLQKVNKKINTKKGFLITLFYYVLFVGGVVFSFFFFHCLRWDFLSYLVAIILESNIGSVKQEDIQFLIRCFFFLTDFLFFFSFFPHTVLRFLKL